MKLLSGILMMLLLWTAQASAEPVVLTVYGNIELNEQQHTQLDFTLSELQALTQADMTTAHPWSAEPRRYRGVDMISLLNNLFSQKNILSLQLEALNDFSVVVNWDQISSYSPILAWQENKQTMSLRNKGPLWLILPFDQVPQIQQADFLHFMIWQLRVIRVHSEPK